MSRWLLMDRADWCLGVGQAADASRRMLAMADRIVMDTPAASKIGQSLRKRPAAASDDVGMHKVHVPVLKKPATARP